MKKVRILSLALAVTMLLSLMTLPASAAYADVAGDHWALSYIEDMTKKGLFKGYEDGLFHPTDTLSTATGLTLCARIISTEAQRKEILEDYAEELNGLFGSDYSWFRAEAAVCLEAGILTYSDLRTLYQNKLLDRSMDMENFAFYMVRALQLEPMAKRLTTYTLPFADQAQISEDKKPYLYLMNIYGVIIGDESKNAKPKEIVRRDRAAALVSKVMAFMDKRGTSVEFPEYTKYNWTAGTIVSATVADGGAISLVLSNDGAENKAVSLSGSVNIYQDSMLVQASSLKAGVYARVCMDEAGAPTAVRLSGGVESFTGGITTMSQSAILLNVGGTARQLNIGRFTQVQVGSKTSDRSIIDLEAGYTNALCKVDDQGDLVFLQLQGGTRIETGLVSTVESQAGGGYALQVRSFDGTLHRYTVPATAVITAGGLTVTTFNSSYSGKHITLRVSNQNGEVVSAQVDTVTRYAQGAIQNFTTTSGAKTLMLLDPTSGTSTTYNLSESAVYTYNDAEVKLVDVKKDWYATIRISGNLVDQVMAYAGFSTTQGTITDIAYGASITITVQKADGTSTGFVVDLNALPTVTRDGAKSSIEKLRKGDTATVTVGYNAVTQIAATSQSANVTGTIQRIAQDGTGTTLDLLLTDGTTTTYVLDSSVTVTQDGKLGSLGDLKYGYQISMVVSDGIVSSITVDKAASSSTESSGTVLLVNITERTVLVQTAAGSAVTISVPYGATILNVSNNQALSLNALKAGDKIQAFGAYEGITFKANIVLRK